MKKTYVCPIIQVVVMCDDLMRFESGVHVNSKHEADVEDADDATSELPWGSND